jgi:hypothetical protein
MACQVGTLSHLLKSCSDHFPSLLCQQGVLNKDPTVWLEGAIPTQISIIMSLASLQFVKICPYEMSVVEGCFWYKHQLNIAY